MASFFDRLRSAFSGPSEPEAAELTNAASLQAELASLDQQALRGDGFEGVPLNKAGDLCIAAGEHDLALDYFGRAVDAYLRDDQPEGARAVAQKIIRLHPGAVRTYRTLVWLDLAAGHMADARRHAEEYVKASKESDHRELSRDQLVAMAAIVDDSSFREIVSRGLESLGFSRQRELVESWGEGGEGAPTPPATEAARRSICFKASISPRNVPDLDSLM